MIRNADTAIRRWSCVVLILVLGPGSTTAASELFTDDAVLEIELAGPLGQLLENREDKVEYPFVLRTNGIEHAIQVRARGNSRLQMCGFPPLRLNFTEQDTDGSIFAGQDKLKLVAHCRDSAAYESYVIREYVAYRIFNVISDLGYRVRLARVTYTDTAPDSDLGNIERYAFLIEPADELARRIAARQAEIPGITIGSLDDAQAARVFVFQYLIGNTDWSLVTADTDDFCCHNVDVFESDGRRVIVPFDFDLSGLVDARYAKPDPSLRLSRVTQRRYRGYCLSSGALAVALEDINARRDEIVAVLLDTPGLSVRERDKSLDFLTDFFAQAADEQGLLQRFERGCL